MLALAADLHPLAAGADGVGQRGVQVQAGAHLVEVGHLQVAAAAHAALRGLQLAEDELEQRGLAATVGADQAHLVAAQDGGAEAVDQRALAEALADVAQLRHDLAAGRARIHFQLHLAQRFAAAGALLTQRLQPLHPAHAAGAPRFHALAHPHLLLRQQLVGAGIGQGFVFQLAGLGGLVGAEVARVAAQHAAVQLDDAGGHRVDEGAVVRDEQQRAAPFVEQRLQPDDGVQVQVVGGLVQQQHVGVGGQRLGQGHALLGAARQRVHHRRGVQVQALQRLVHPAFPVPAVQRLDAGLDRVQVVAGLMRLVAGAQGLGFGHALAHHLEHRGTGREVGLLRHIEAAHVLLRLQQAVVQLFQAGQHLEQRRLAGTVAADQRDPFTRLQRKARAIEQRDVAEGQMGVGK